MSGDSARLPAAAQPDDAAPSLGEFLIPSGENGALARFNVESRCCRNPECDCQEVVVDLHDPVSEERLTIVVPLDQRAPSIRGARLKGADALLQELRNCLGLSFWEHAKRTYENAKEYGRQHPWEYLSFERGLLVPYYDLVAPGPEEVLEFTCEKQPYLVIDQYCLEPSCDCRSVMLDVQRLRTVAPGQADARPYAVTFYDFRRSRFTPGPEGPLTSSRRTVMTAFLASRPDMKAYLWQRYERAREIGRKVAERGGFVDPKPQRPPETRQLRRR